jgi:uncharacterized protein YgbK (DUF1537 family)
MRIRKDKLLSALPPEWPEDLLPTIRAMVEESGTKIVVLDDDPTGTQTVYNVPVLTEWSPDTLKTVLAEPDALVYILTNSRSLPLTQARAMNHQIASNLKAAGGATERKFVVVSRSDSTLRGHYPGEVEALTEGLGRRFDGTLIIPFFLEGGRLTVHDTHYVSEGDWLVPAAETEFARDPTFGYENSNLTAWVSEKHQGEVRQQDVASIPLTELRTGGPEAVAAKLNRLSDGGICVVNAATYSDMQVFVAGLLRTEAAGKRFVYRTAASFVRVRGGLPPRNLLTAADLVAPNSKKGGLIIVGSYVKKSTLQVEAAQSLSGMTSLEISVSELLDTHRRDDLVKRMANRVDELLGAGRDTLVYTSRHLITGSDRASTLEIGQKVSSGLVAIVDHLSVTPDWLIAKGGITSSDIATKGLKIQRAQVLGQALPGIPIWRTGEESRWPGLIYVVFPGNVGGVGALAEMVQILRGKEPH